MTFSYGYDLANSNLDRVRFEVGDTDSEAYFLEDEEITSILSLQDDDWQKAALACIRAIIGKLSRPTFTADWLRVDNNVALKSYRGLLAEKEDEYGISIGVPGAWFESGSTDVTRGDVTDYVDYTDDFDEIH